MLIYGSKVYRVDETMSGGKEEIRAESATEALLKYLKHDAEFKDAINDIYNWDFEVTRIR